MRSWTARISALASVVRMVNVRRISPSALFQPSERAAKASGCPSTLAMAKGCFPSTWARYREQVGRHDRSALGQGALEQAGRGDGLDPSVGRLPRRLQVLREPGHQGPRQEVKPSIAGIRVAAHDGRALRWRDVPGRLDVR